MSSTNRSGEHYTDRKQISDYYCTPIPSVVQFLNEFIKDEPDAFNGIVLDPCAGGDANHPMSYPTGMIEVGVNKENIKTIDIREDALAELKANYLELSLGYKPRIIITNPPFLYAPEIIEKALDDVGDDGFVIMLLRLNFFGGKARKKMWEKQMPKYTYVHHRRMSFTDDGKTDSIEYAHFVWQKGYKENYTYTKVI